MKHTFPGGAFNYLLFSPRNLGKMNLTHFDETYLIRWVGEKPPTRFPKDTIRISWWNLHPRIPLPDRLTVPKDVIPFTTSPDWRCDGLGVGVDGMNGKDPNKVVSVFLFCFVCLVGWLVVCLFVCLFGLFVCLVCLFVGFVCLFLAWCDMNKDTTEVKGVAQYVTGWLIQSGGWNPFRRVSRFFEASDCLPREQREKGTTERGAKKSGKWGMIRWEYV